MYLLDPPADMFLTAVTSLACLLLPSVSAQTKCGVPEAVANLKAQNITNTTTHLSWDPPASTECADHYKITYCSYLNDEVRECAIKTAILPLNTTQYDVTQLKPCRYNLIQVHTVGVDGSEIYEEMILYTGSGDPPKLDKVNLDYVGAINVSVSWEIPRGYSEQCYPGFKVCFSAKGDSEETCAFTIDSEFITPSAAAPLSPCTEYNFSVATVDGNFAPESKTSARTYVSVVTAPQTPNITVEVRNGTAHAAWQAPDALSMNCAASYLVKNCRMAGLVYPEDCQTVWSETLPLNATEATVTGLRDCTDNYVSVNLVGNNGHSSSKEVVLDAYDEIPVPLDVTVSDVTNSELTFNFNEGRQDCVRAFQTCWSTEGEDETCVFIDTGYSTTLMYLDLKPCSKYSVNFTALGTNGKLSKNSTTSFLTGPGDVRYKMAELSPHSALLSWSTPPTLQCATDINITWRRYTSSDRVQRAVLPVNATTYNITGLSSCTEYVVSFSTDGDNGTTSGEISSVFYTRLADVGPITNFDFFYVNGIVFLDIFFPDNSLHCIRTYVTCWYETGESQGQQHCEEGPLSWASGVLNACVNYTFEVTASTDDNRTISGSSTFTPGPVKVSNLKVNENAVERTVNLSWTNPPTNHLCVEYIQVTETRVEDNKATQEKISNDATSVLLRDLTPCTTYLFEVKPVLSGDNSGSTYLARYTTSCSDATSLP